MASPAVSAASPPPGARRELRSICPVFSTQQKKKTEENGGSSDVSSARCALGLSALRWKAGTMMGLPLLVLASKHDLTPRAPAQSVVSLDLLARSSLRWRLQPCSLVGSTGLVTDERAQLSKGLHWLAQEMREAGGETVRSSNAAQIFGPLEQWLR